MLSSFVARLKALLHRRSSDAELDEELRYHLEREIERNVANGMTATDAHRAARLAFGNVTSAAEQARDATRWRAIEEFRQDVAYAMRTFRRAPLFVVTVVATIGLGLGLLASAFTFFDAYVLRSLAVRDPHSLFDLGWSSANGARHRFTSEQYEHLRVTHSFFSESFAYTNEQTRLRGRPALGQFVSGNYFQMLGVPPAIGRAILPSDASEPGANPVIVLSHQTWRTTFGGDSSVIGTRVAVNGMSLEIIGVAREGFGGLTSAPFDFWVPITMRSSAGTQGGAFRRNPGDDMFVIGRLAPGISEERARAMLLTHMRGATAHLPPLERANNVTLLARGTSIPRNPETVAIFAPVIVAFLLVMLIACANVANIMLARGMARQREIGIRLALGAGRRRLIRQLLTEAVLLAVPAGAVGFAISRATLWVSLHVMFSTVPAAYAPYIRIIPLDASANVAAFMLLAAMASAVVFGLVPALQATRPNIVQASRGDFETQYRPSRLRNALVVAQITLSVLLLVAAGVLLSAARHTARVEPGIRTRDVVQISLLAAARQRGLDALRADPLVRAVGGSNSTALDGRFNEVLLVARQRPSEVASYNIVSPGYFQVLDLPILRGRNFTDDDARSRAAVTVISQSTASHFWPGRDPIGETLTVPPASRDYKRLEPYHSVRVIGVTTDAVPGFIGDDPRRPTVYFPRPLDGTVNEIIVRVTGDANVAQATLERRLAQIDSSSVVEMHTLDESLALQVYPFRAMYWVASALGVIALLLTLIGVYGVMSYLVAQRRKEFGIRLALGAAGSSLVALVLRQSMRLALTGVALGVVLALSVSRLFASVIFNLNTYDTFGYAAGVGLVLLACLFAAYAPSRRAAAVNPVEALRADS